MKDLTFVIPIRHPHNLRSPDMQVQILGRTFRSYTAQTEDNWRAVVVANPGTPLPDLPSGFETVWVDYEPNPKHEFQEHKFLEVMDAVRFDKGRRIWAGMKAFPDSRYFMFMDDDDLISRRLVEFVKRNSGGYGWFVKKGYGINHAGSYAIELNEFHLTSGSSHIVRKDLFNLPAQDDKNFKPYVSKWLGSHGHIAASFAKRGHALDPLPFRGAVYLTNNPNSHSNSNSVLRNYVFNKEAFLAPWTLPGKLSRLRLIDGRFREEFMGDV